ncbi:MAG: hypothetical protein O7G85_15010, partial [Planctomycetota bacterium]|nr:hypothetical protein [Planctomycetota bacterium]
SADFRTQLELFKETDEQFLMADVSVLQQFNQRRSIQKAMESLRNRIDDPIVMLPIMVKIRTID